MKIKIIAAVLAAMFCVAFAAGCGEEEQSSASAAETVTEGKTNSPNYEISEEPAEKSYSYEAANVKFNSAVNIEDFISGDKTDINELAQSVSYEKTSEANEWTIPSNGIRIVVGYTEPKDGVISGVTVRASHMDGTKDVYTLTYTAADDAKTYSFGDNKIAEPLIAITAYALENAPRAEANDPFAEIFKEYKNDKGEYVLTEK